jgi:hypothetical protein
VTPDAIFTLAGQFGPLGMMIGYLLMRDNRADKLEEKKAEADKQLATSLALLTAAIQGLK